MQVTDKKSIHFNRRVKVRLAVYILNNKELKEFCNKIKQSKALGIDLEFIPENTYYPALSLIQVSVNDTFKLIDPLKNLDLSPLFEIVADKEIVKIVHAGTQDMGIFFNLTSVIPKSVFDTQTASAFLDMGAQISYGAMVKELFNVSLSKTEGFTNWMKRPLTNAQEKYALEDVKYLLPAYKILVGRLKKLKRYDWLTEELQKYESSSFYTLPLSKTLYKIKRRNQVEPKNAAILQQLAIWREQTARKINLPRKRVLHDDTLIEIAKICPKNENILINMRALDLHNVKKHSKNILKAIKTGLKQKEIPSLHKNNNGQLSGRQKRLVEFLLFSLRAYCIKHKISMQTVASRSDVEDFVRLADNTDTEINHCTLMTGWRKDFAGSFLLQCLKGKIAFSLTPESGNIIFSQK